MTISADSAAVSGYFVVEYMGFRSEKVCQMLRFCYHNSVKCIPAV